jgi:hypothetical protein
MAAPNSNANDLFALTGLPRLLDALIGNEIRRVDQLLAQPRFAACEYQPDGQAFPCGRKAVVTALDSERDYCLEHFREVEE